MRLICLVMHLVFSKILKYALQTFLRFDSNVPPQIQNSLLFMVHIHMIYTGFTHFCREISLVAITRFGRHFLAKIGGRRHKNIFEDRAESSPAETEVPNVYVSFVWCFVLEKPLEVISSL